MLRLMRTQVRPDTKADAKTKRRERGQSLVEMAIVFPILLLFLAAAIDFGRVFDAYIVMTNAVREGARFGSVKPDLTVDEVKQIVVDDVLGSGTNITQMTDFGLGNVTVEGQAADSEVVRVEATYDFDLWFGGIIGFRTITVTKDASMPRWRE
jgi:Flp pilus assembly protein TadG